MKTTRHLDMGCGNRIRNPYQAQELYGVDFGCSLPQERFRKADLSLDPLPFDDGFFDSVSAYDVLEHIPRVVCINAPEAASGMKTRNCFIELMNEVWRVLKLSGRFYAVTPAFPSKKAFIDPTHVNFITDRTHHYFCGNHPLAGMYGFVGRFKCLRAKRIRQKYDFEPLSLSPSQSLRKMVDFVGRKRHHMLWEFEAVKHER
jgi:SAM-dependent methyltransferase